MNREDYTDEQWSQLTASQKKAVAGRAKNPLKGFGSWDKERLIKHNKEMARRSAEARRVKDEGAQED